MINRIVFSALIVFLMTGCGDKNTRDRTVLGRGTQYEYAPEELQGKVKSLVEKNYWAVPDGDSFKISDPLTQADRDTVVWAWSDDFKILFDEEGDFVSAEGLDEHGRQTWKNQSIKKNNLITRINHFRNDTMIYYDSIRYSQNGHITGGERYFAANDSLMGRAIFRTNGAGYLTESAFLNLRGDTTGKIINSYDEKNRSVNLKYLDNHGNARNAFDAKYDSRGNLTEIHIRNKDNKIIESNYLAYEYDQKGNWIRAVVKDVKGTVTRYIIAERTFTYY